MKNIILKYVLIMALSVVFFILSISYEVNLFVVLAAILPFFWILPRIQQESLIIFFLLVISTINISHSVFVEYMIHPWFKTDPNNCDGPCFGWYMFEKSQLPSIVLNNLTLIFTLGVVLLLCRYTCDKNT